MPAEDEDYAPIENFELVPCSVCSRKFRTDIIKKHETICQKASKRKPKIFDSGKMRAQGTGIPLNKTIRPGEVVPREPNKDERLIRAERKRDNWRAKHMEFIKTIRSAKAYQNAVSKGNFVPPPPPAPSAVDPDLIQCQYCGRRFNETAAERHIPFCKEKSERERVKRSTAATANKPLRNAGSRPIAGPSSGTQRKGDLPSKCAYQQPPVKSPAPPKNPKGDGHFSSNTRSHEPATTLPPTHKKPGSRPPSQSRSPLQSANANRGPKNPTRYGDFDHGCLYDKPHSPALSSASLENARNISTVEMETPLPSKTLLDYESSARPGTRGLPTGGISLRPLSRHSSASDHSSVHTKGSVKHISPVLPHIQSPPLNNNSAYQGQTAAFRTGRSQQHYMEAHAFTKGLVKSQNQACGSLRMPEIWPKQRGALHADMTGSGDTQVANSSGFDGQVDFDRVDRIGNREKMLESNCKLGVRPSRRMAMSSGIPVRATSVHPKREPLVSRQQRSQIRSQGKGCFCHECGAKFPSLNARFCPDCGVKRMAV